ncbi:MAG TPA: FecR domain-containing protein [Bdellovibrionota bacterium]|jgi:hypothetical protein
MKTLLLLALLLPIPHAFAEEGDEPDEQADCQLALVEDMGGGIELVSSDGKSAPLEKGQGVELGELLKTGPAAWVDLRLCDGSGLRVGENSKFYYEGAPAKDESFLTWAFRLVDGSVFGTVVGDGKSERVKLRVRTPTAALGVRGTEFVVESTGEGETSLHTLEGEVLMGSAGDFDSMAELRGKELDRKFERVGLEKMSRIAKGERRARRAERFKLDEFRAKRSHFFERRIQRQKAREIRQHFREARKKRNLFRRQHMQLENRMQRQERRQEQRQEVQQRREQKQQQRQERQQRRGTRRR